MSALLWPHEDNQNEGYRERDVGLWVGLPAMWRRYRFIDRYSPPVAPGAARDLGAFGCRCLLGHGSVSPIAVGSHDRLGRLMSGIHGR